MSAAIRASVGNPHTGRMASYRRWIGEWNDLGPGAVRPFQRPHEEAPMAKPHDPREEAEKAKKKPGGQQHQNPPKKTSTDNPERNPRDQKGRGGTK